MDISSKPKNWTQQLKFPHLNKQFLKLDKTWTPIE